MNDRRTSGFALVDVIVATVLLGVSLAVLLGLNARSINLARIAHERAQAALLADEQLHLILARGPDDYQRRFPTEGPFDGGFEAYRYRIDIDGGSLSEPYRVRVVVEWESMGRERSVSVETLMAVRNGDDPDPDRAPEETVGRVQ